MGRERKMEELNLFFLFIFLSVYLSLLCILLAQILLLST